MKRLLLGVLIAIGMVANGAVSTQALDTNNFRIQDYDIRYELTKGTDGRSNLKTTERITAIFPDFDQNHGIERVIPETFNSHPTNIQIKSVETNDGAAWQYSTRSDSGNLILRIGSASSYVHGMQTYVITYTQKDVARYFENTNDDEFYWDTNGTDWAVPIDRLTVLLVIDEKLQDSLTGKASCYMGYNSENNSCTLNQAANTFTTEAANLDSGQNVTIAVGFKPHTFAEYEAPLIERVIAVYTGVSIVVGVIAAGAIVWLCIKWGRWSSRKKEVGTIVPEYLPPSDASLATMASIIKPTGSVFTAQLLDFAVRHYIKVYETSKKSFFGKIKYTIEISKDPASLKAEEQEILADIFQGKPAVGTRLDLSSLQSNSAVYKNMSDNNKKLNELVRGAYALRERNAAQSEWFKKAGWILLVVGIICLNPAMLVAALIAFVCGTTLWPLTDKGVALYRYAEGMKMYIHVAETERLRMLQSPEGAAKVGGVDVADGAQLVKLYERMLPYAVLFGQEKEWSKQIGELYESSQTAPDWYIGQSAFNAAVFSSTMSSFTTSVAYSSPYESSSGGSSGGGSSGGGGGGGGGGGW